MWIRRGFPVASILDAVFTVSPKRQYRGIFTPITPATQLPDTECTLSILPGLVANSKRSKLYRSVFLFGSSVFRRVCAWFEIVPLSWANAEPSTLFLRRAGFRFSAEVHWLPCRRLRWFLLCKRRTDLGSNRKLCKVRSVNELPAETREFSGRKSFCGQVRFIGETPEAAQLHCTRWTGLASFPCGLLAIAFEVSVN